MKIPDVIYLQICDVDENDGWGIDRATWCQDRLNSSDIKYVRADKDPDQSLPTHKEQEKHGG